MRVSGPEKMRRTESILSTPFRDMLLGLLTSDLRGPNGRRRLESGVTSWNWTQNV